MFAELGKFLFKQRSRDQAASFKPLMRIHVATYYFGWIDALIGNRYALLNSHLCKLIPVLVLTSSTAPMQQAVHIIPVSLPADLTKVLTL